MTDISSHPTPFYLYDLALLRRTLDAIKSASAVSPNFRVHYALKANYDSEILRMIANHGFGADTVSAGEIKIAIDHGFAPEKIMFAGVGKTDDEIRYALNAGIGCFNVESEPELFVIAEIAEEMGVVAPVALRVNPDIDAHTHHYITTGVAENKFGIAMHHLDALIDKMANVKSVQLKGLHFHIGSQITTMEPYRLLCERINNIVADLEKRGIAISTINVGGGLGIDYDNPEQNPITDFASYFKTFADYLCYSDKQTVHFELGRAMVAQVGRLITKVLYVKEGDDKIFVITDAGMTELLRPALYGAYHKIVNLSNPEAQEITADIVGPICESTDILAENRPIAAPRRGDLLAILSAGAYGETMASHYNARTLAPTAYNSSK